MIVDRSQTPEAAKPTLVAESAVSIPPATLAPRRYFLYIEALKSRSFSRRNLTSHMLKAVSFSALKWRVEGYHAVRSDLITLEMGYWPMTTAV